MFSFLVRERVGISFRVGFSVIARVRVRVRTEVG
jgi:hypothetical protein